MPIIDIEIVTDELLDTRLARALADALGAALHTPAGQAWVRLRRLPTDAYAENGVSASDDLPAFVTVLRAQPPDGAALAAEVAAVTEVIAARLGRPRERVHVEYAPAAAGRMAFGGRLVE
jgi:phenylpyruvate tautomerase PptA (4-oxalocrotonate tautomerase family)